MNTLCPGTVADRLLEMVGEEQRPHGMASFCKPFTKATVRYFERADAAEVRNWLGEA